MSCDEKVHSVGKERESASDTKTIESDDSVSFTHRRVTHGEKKICHVDAGAIDGNKTIRKQDIESRVSYKPSFSRANLCYYYYFYYYSFEYPGRKYSYDGYDIEIQRDYHNDGKRYVSLKFHRMNPSLCSQIYFRDNAHPTQKNSHVT